MNIYIVLNIIALALVVTMCILVYENSHLERQEKLKFCMIYIFICVAMFAEAGGLLLNNAPAWTIPLHKIVKCLDYCLTPMTGLAIIFQVSGRDKFEHYIRALMLVNIVFQIMSIFTGWTFYVDAQNVYHHGPLYMGYVIIYVLTTIAVFIKFYIYGSKYKRKHRRSLVAIFIMVLMALLLQEACGFRVCYLVLTMAAIFLFIHYTEFAQFASTQDLLYHKKLLETDVLTGLYSRHAYTEDLKVLETAESLSDQLVVFSVDINELKNTNDTLGHLAGDELIRGASGCISQVLGTYGKCYRTGGDEFIAFLYMDPAMAYTVTLSLRDQAQKWHGTLIDHLSLSIGYAIAAEHPDVQIEKLINLADEKMYEAKAAYYMQTGKNRRSSDVKKREAIEKQQQEYIDIISAFASDVTGLYVIDRRKEEVTAYRISESDHRILNGVPVEMGFEAAMRKFADKHVHPDDQEMMRQSSRVDVIERELQNKHSFLYHFRTITNGEIRYHYMKCIKNVSADSYDKIIVSFCPEDNLNGRRKVADFLKVGESRERKTVMVVSDDEEVCRSLNGILSLLYTCIEVHEGQKAMELLKNHYEDISVIFYQQSMHDLSAVQYLENAQKDLFLSSVPIIVIVDQAEQKTLKDATAKGAIDFIVQPFFEDVILRRTRNITNMHNVMVSLDEIELDDLTGLYTKSAFMYHAKALIDANPNQSFAVIISDVLNFKRYNSIYGRSKADELLVMLGEYIRKMVRNGICARYGADQFVCIMRTPLEEPIDTYMRRLQNHVNEQGIEGVILKFGVYEDINKMLEMPQICDRALMALKSIKANFNRDFARFDGPVSQQLLRDQTYEANFTHALENHEFEVWYQPKYNIYTEKIIGAEALVRWRTKDGLISPGLFLPVFEADGLISRLDEYVFKVVCAQQKKWMQPDKEMIPISVNLSRSSMHHSDVVSRYKSIIEAYGLRPEMIPIEITESAALGNEEIKPLADAFYEAGFKLHMDDFGSGKSSIAGLNMLHFDTVKLDKSLIDYIDQEDGRLVLMYTVALGMELGMDLVAEGVETKEQIEYLKDIGCANVQGYYFSKPLPVDAFEQEATTNIDEKVAKYDYRYKMTAADSVVKRAMDRMLHRMPGGFFTYRAEDGCILSSNSYLWNLFGCESEDEFMQYVGGNFNSFVAPEDLDQVNELINRQINNDAHKMDYVEYEIIRKDGKRIPVVDYGHLDHQPDGDIFYVLINEAGK